jgi:hypothetical protein
MNILSKSFRQEVPELVEGEKLYIPYILSLAVPFVETRIPIAIGSVSTKGTASERYFNLLFSCPSTSRDLLKKIFYLSCSSVPFSLLTSNFH